MFSHKSVSRMNHWGLNIFMWNGWIDTGSTLSRGIKRSVLVPRYLCDELIRIDIRLSRLSCLVYLFFSLSWSYWQLVLTVGPVSCCWNLCRGAHCENSSKIYICTLWRSTHCDVRPPRWLIIRTISHHHQIAMPSSLADPVKLPCGLVFPNRLAKVGIPRGVAWH